MKHSAHVKNTLGTFCTFSPILYNQNDLTDLNSENRCIINNHMIKNRLNFEILKIRQEKKNSNIGTKFWKK